jgi:hypothetical protein
LPTSSQSHTHPNPKVCRPATDQKSKYHIQTITCHTNQCSSCTPQQYPRPPQQTRSQKKATKQLSALSHSIPNPSGPASEATWRGSREKLKPAASASHKSQGLSGRLRHIRWARYSAVACPVWSTRQRVSFFLLEVAEFCFLVKFMDSEEILDIAAAGLSFIDPSMYTPNLSRVHV